MKTSKYFSIIFIIIIFSFNFGIFFNLISKHLDNENTSNSLNERKKCSNYIDWKKEYPFDKTKDCLKDKNSNKEILKNHSDNHQDGSKKLESMNAKQIYGSKIAVEIHKIYNKIKNIINMVDFCSKRDIPFKLNLIEVGHFINKILGGNLFLKMDNLIRFDNGYLGYLIPEKDSFYSEGKRTVNFAKYLESQNIKFAFILCPSKLSKFKKELPKGMIDYSNYNSDSFLKILYENNINVLDLREDLNKEFTNHFDAFFKADHHWKPETGFWASQKIIKYLNYKLGQKLDEDVIKNDKFNFNTYPKLYLGSQGRKVTLSLAEPEDITVITPKFETDFKFEVFCWDIKKEGSFEKSLLATENLEKDYYNINNYATYLGKIPSIVKINNKTNMGKSKILIIKDSFIHVVAPFLACVTKDIVLVEFRPYLASFDGSIKKFIEKEKPDVVLVFYHSGLFNPNSSDRKYLFNFE